MRKKYIISIGIVVGGAILAFLLIKLGMSADVVSVMIGGIYTFASVELYSAHKEDQKTKSEVVDEIKKRRDRHPLLVFISALAIIEVAWNACSFFLGVVVGMAFAESGGEYFDITPYLSAINEVSVVIMAVTVAPIAIYVAHRIKKYALLWILAVVIVNQALLVLQTLLIFQDVVLAGIGALTLSSVYMILLLVPGSLVGYFVAKKTQRAFTMLQIFKRVSTTDKTALIELVDSLPSVTRHPRKS